MSGPELVVYQLSFKEEGTLIITEMLDDSTHLND